MNNERRTEIMAVVPILQNALVLINSAKGIIEDAKSDESEAYDAMPEGMRNGDKGEAMQSAINALEEAVDGLDGIDLTGVVNAIQEATDRAADIDAPAAKLTDDEREARRMDRLPQWAKDRMERLTADRDATAAKMAAMFSDPVEGSKRPVVGDYSSPINGKEIPAERVEFPQLGITVELDTRREGVTLSIHSNFGMLNIIPMVSNHILIGTRG